MNRDDIILFAGPSLPTPCDAESTMAVQRHGPAAQGDVLRAALLRPRAIILIDGFFEASPAVYHKEILWALSEGIPVYGAASTGALRAAELSSYGMVGVGCIFEAFLDGNLVRDDEVALIHAPQEIGYAYLSEPLINIRHTLAAAVAADIVSPETATELCHRAQRAFYPDRNYKMLVSECKKIEPDVATCLGDWLPTGQIDQKNLDARACLDRVAADFAADEMKVDPCFMFSHTDAFETLMDEVLSALPSDDPDVLERLRIASPDRYELLRAHAESAELALMIEQQSPHPISPADLAREVSDFRLSHGLPDPIALKRWLERHDLDIDTLSKKLEERARIARTQGSVQTRLETRMHDLLIFADNMSATTAVQSQDVD